MRHLAPRTPGRPDLVRRSCPSAAAVARASPCVALAPLLGCAGPSSELGPPGSGLHLAAGLALGALGALLARAAFVERRRAREAELAREADRRRILFEASPDGMVLLDPATGAFTEFNTAAHAQLGYTREEFGRLTVLDLEAAETPEQTRRHMAEVAKGTRDDFETLQRTKQGELRNVHVTAQTLQVMGQRVYQCVWRDVTERRRLDEALREADRRVRQIGDSLPGGFVFQTHRGRDGELRYTYVSAGVEALLGVSPEAVLRDRLALSGATAEANRARVADAATQAALAMTPFSVEIPMRSRAGRDLWVQISAAPTALPDGAFQFDGVALDVTARRRAESDRLVVSKLESTGLLAGGIAHDFNNLLTSILLDVELARDEARTGAARTALTNVIDAVTAAQALTRQLITFAEGGRPVRAPVDLEPLVREATRLALVGSPVGSRIAVAPDLWPAELDAGQIRQVIRSLVQNAREAMPRGGAVSVALRNRTVDAGAGAGAAPGPYVEVEIADEGVGIPAEILPRIFDPYFSTKERGDEKGMGLGLTICHSVVKKHGGAISVESEAGKGATFRVLLPARPGARSGGAPGLRRPAAGSPACGTVLVMEDDAPLRTMVVNTLEAQGCRVLQAATGEQAVERWAEARADGTPVDLLLLDVTVPGGMGGVEALRLLREVDPETPAVLMGSSTGADAALDPAQHGFAAALPKPFDAEALRAAVAQHLSPR